MAIRVAIFDDVLAARGEVFHIPGLEVTVYPHADEVLAVCAGELGAVPDVLMMDYAMGPDHANGADATRAARKAGFAGRIVGTSSDPRANALMIEAGASEAILNKAMLRSFLVALGREAGGEASG